MASPSLNALRAFEAAARLQSFSRAANELSVTHGAVSHQVRGLEERVGAKLFQRKNRKMLLTPTGESLVHRVRQGLLTLDEVFAPRKTIDDGQKIAVSTLSSFATNWLAPRLISFHGQHPNINLQLQIETTHVDFSMGYVDAAIRYGAGGWSGLHEKFLFDDYLIPVCTPELAEHLNLSGPADLLQAPLISNLHQPWFTWFLQVGVPSMEPPGIFSADDSGVTLMAARQGVGVALSRFSLVFCDLKLKRLVAPIRIKVKDSYAYYLVHPQSTANQGPLEVLFQWLLEEGNMMLQETDLFSDT